MYSHVLRMRTYHVVHVYPFPVVTFMHVYKKERYRVIMKLLSVYHLFCKIIYIVTQR
jgi:hypothetical protein